MELIVTTNLHVYNFDATLLRESTSYVKRLINSPTLITYKSFVVQISNTNIRRKKQQNILLENTTEKKSALVKMA